MRPESPPPLVGEENLARSEPEAGGMPDLSGMANMLGGMGRGGGMPDISTLMSNPAIMQMAQNMMANGGMERLMQNPALAGMVRQLRHGLSVSD